MKGLLDRTIKPRPKVRTKQPRDATLLIDADHGLGLVESRKAMDPVIVLAKKQVWARLPCATAAISAPPAIMATSRPAG